MSRSYKHTPYCGMFKDKFFKHYANKQFRKKSFDENYQYNDYRKTFESYWICDYYHIEKFFESYYDKELFHWWYSQSFSWGRKKLFPTKEEVWKEYNKYYIRK